VTRSMCIGANAWFVAKPVRFCSAKMNLMGGYGVNQLTRKSEAFRAPLQLVTAAVSLRFHFFGRNVLNAVAAINTCASAGSTDTSFIPPYEFCPAGVFVRK